MSMRKIYRLQGIWPLLLVLAAMVCAPSAHAQKLKDRMIERSAEQFDYNKVVVFYEDRVAKGKASSDDLRNLAQTYQKLEDSQKAEATYTKLMATGEQQPADLLAYADQLRANGRYTVAMEWYGNYKDVNSGDTRVNAYMSDPTLLTRLMRDSTFSKVRKVPINSPQADFGMCVMNNLLIFSSARGEGVGGKRTYIWDKQPFLNLYSALLKGETAVDPVVMRKDVNSRYHDGTVTYDSTAHRMYFTRNNVHYGTVQKSKDGYLNLGIYFSDVVTGEYGQQEWDALIPFDHADVNDNYGHPCVSKDGRLMFFVSDKPGGVGGTDIYVCKKIGDLWGKPVNMGPIVNSTGDEMFPFLRGDSTLFFTSTGHPGLGGYDIFASRLTPDGPKKPRNLGYPLNTRYNDHGLILITDTTGFFASDRPGGQGSDDIYGCTIPPEMVVLKGMFVDSDSREPLSGVSFVLKKVNGDPVTMKDIEMTDDGKFKLNTERSDEFVLVANKLGYQEREFPINAKVDDLENLVIDLVGNDHTVEGVVTDATTDHVIADAIVVLTDSKDEHVKTVHTDAQGRYSFALKGESDYRIRVGKDGYFKQSARISTKGKPKQVHRKDFKLVKLQVDAVIRLDNILYDYAKWNIRPDAALELDNLVAILQENPTVKIELSSHTDCRGKDAYNLTLSEKRAKSAVDYIISKGIPRENVVSKGYGETLPSEKCDCTKCSEEEHQRNRRSEFKILSL